MQMSAQDLDVHLLGRIAQLIQPNAESSAALREVLSAFHGVWHRFSACTAHEEAFRELVMDEDTAAHTRGSQEKELYEYLVTGKSAIECASYAVYRYASCLTLGMRFRTSVQNMHLHTCVNAFKRSFPSAVLTQVLAEVDSSREWGAWKKARSILVRQSYAGGRSTRGPITWLRSEFGVMITVDRHAWLTPVLQRLLEASEEFISVRPVRICKKPALEVRNQPRGEYGEIRDSR
jgi:hypothetical protein